MDYNNSVIRPTPPTHLTPPIRPPGTYVYFAINVKLKGSTNYTINIPDRFAYNPSSDSDYAPGLTWSFRCCYI